MLLGPTQAGKTSLMRLIAGLDHPSTGRVVVDGKEVTGISVRQRHLAMMYQQVVLGVCTLLTGSIAGLPDAPWIKRQ